MANTIPRFEMYQKTDDIEEYFEQLEFFLKCRKWQMTAK